MPEESSKTFFSYAREDSGFVLRLVKDLKAAGAAVWLDERDIVPGKPWEIEVERALRECTNLVIVLSPAAVNSRHVMDEVSFALDEGKRVIPLMYRECTVPLPLRRLQRIDFEKDYDSGLRGLLKALEHEKNGDDGQEKRTGWLGSKGVWIGAVGLLMVVLALGFWLKPKPRIVPDCEESSSKPLPEDVRSELDKLTKVDPQEKEQAVIHLAERWEDSLPQLCSYLGSQEVVYQDAACDVLQRIGKAQGTARPAILGRLLQDIQGSNRYRFRGAAQCASLPDFVGEEEIEPFLKAIENRLGRPGLCTSKNADNDEVIRAINAESRFPLPDHAPDFLIGIIRNCPDGEFHGARLSAMKSLPQAFKNVYKQNCDTELNNRLEPLEQSLRNEILRMIGNPPCQEAQ